MSPLPAQTLYVPGGTAGISDVTNGSGNVGIGTSAPRGALDVAGRNLYLGTIPVAVGYASNGYPGIGYNFSAQADGTWRYLGTDTAYMIGLGQANHIDFNVAPTGSPGAVIPWTTAMSITNTGNVGIGTTAPQTRLQISAPAGAPIVVRKNAAFVGAFYIDFQNASGTELAYVGFGSAGNDSLCVYNSIADAPLVFGTSASERARIDGAGNFGIGTPTPTHKLTVNGAVRAKEVIVDTGWSDYVFADDYRLAPLSEVERHIKTERHLPGIPSAAEVGKDGVSVGEMQAKLLAQIEQLTLHVIAQEKEIARLKARVAQLAPTSEP